MKFFNFSLVPLEPFLHDALALAGLHLLRVVACPLLQQVHLAAHVPHLQEAVLVVLQLSLERNKKLH